MSAHTPNWMKSMKAKEAVRRKLAVRQGAYMFGGRWCFSCPICGRPTPVYDSSTIDHIIPVSLGGAPHHIDNLQLVCRYCNELKGSSLPWELEEKLGKPTFQTYGLWAGKFKEVSA